MEKIVSVALTCLATIMILIGGVLIVNNMIKTTNKSLPVETQQNNNQFMAIVLDDSTIKAADEFIKTKANRNEFLSPKHFPKDYAMPPQLLADINKTQYQIIVLRQKIEKLVGVLDGQMKLLKNDYNVNYKFVKMGVIKAPSLTNNFLSPNTNK